ncbi:MULTISPECIES: hypothetical protein [Stenotrophomonas]|uniref:hypothetical protein n=1 Tax=Stenotrophomonas TaxID=40323 RepID=UPI00117F97B5|nr:MULTISPECIES: hypothetical protein [Stenotrophomonas]MBH1738544.1 hypothetical protein [Stenotrophomonas maltophilia]WNB79539.1 hypothetical protein Q9R16_17285 [Stenotrophomonas sp. 9]
MTGPLAATDVAFVERADELDEATLVRKTVDNQFYLDIRRRLLSQGAKLLVGPRGTGKTHQMRFVYQECVRDSTKPAAIFSSFSRYVRLEPLLKTSRSAVTVFQSWVIAKISLAGFALLRDIDHPLDRVERSYLDCFELNSEEAERFVSFIESRGGKEVIPPEGFTLGALHQWFDELLRLSNRSRLIVLLDDAALSMTPEYLVEFFNIFQDLKSPTVSPKASVYPGTSQYGPRLHLRHDVQPINAWLSIEDPAYDDTMSKLIDAWSVRLAELPEGVVDLFKYASFGVPRVLMSLLRAYVEGSWVTVQQGVNAVIEQQVELMIAEYESLAQKVPQFGTVIGAGATLFNSLANQVAEANRQQKDSRQVIVGIAAKDIRTLETRMLRFLVEVGLLYPMSSVKHGDDRAYLRFIPHLAPLIFRRAFEHSSGFSAKRQVAVLRADHKRQPLRFSLSKLLPDVHLHLDLARCTRCDTSRLSEVQKFCHNCGAELINQSAYEACMALSIDVLPITERQKEALREQFSTIGDIIAAQDPATELRTYGLIGQRRAANIAEKAQKYVDEYFS